MGHCDLRKGRHTLPSQPYLVTFTTLGRDPLFADPALAGEACRAIADARLWSEARLDAWVLMPDHWHGLLTLGGSPLSTVVQRLKANVGRRVNLARGIRTAIWAKAYHDRALRREDDLRLAARYIVANPVRAGLVKRVGDYPYWDARWLDYL